jgi:hypothetical protein
MKENTSDSTTDVPSPNYGNPTSQGGTNDSVSLVPACLVVLMFVGVILSVTCAAASYFINQNQSLIASRSIREQLIPWVEQSPLEATDKSTIIDELNEITRQIDEEQLDEAQLRRLRFRLTDNPALMWGYVQAALGAVAASTELTELEKEQASRTSERLLRLVSEGKLTRSALEFVLQSVTLAKSDRSGLVVKENPSTDDLRQFIKRGGEQADGLKASLEPFDKSPSQVFLMMIDDALAPPAPEVAPRQPTTGQAPTNVTP